MTWTRSPSSPVEPEGCPCHRENCPPPPRTDPARAGIRGQHGLGNHRVGALDATGRDRQSRRPRRPRPTTAPRRSRREMPDARLPAQSGAMGAGESPLARQAEVGENLSKSRAGTRPRQRTRRPVKDSPGRRGRRLTRRRRRHALSSRWCCSRATAARRGGSGNQRRGIECGCSAGSPTPEGLQYPDDGHDDENIETLLDLPVHRQEVVGQPE